MFRNLNCLIGLLNSDYLVSFKFRNSKFHLKGNFVNNLENSNVRRFLNSYALKCYEARRLKQ